MAKYTCNHGYILYGEITRICDYNGKWTGKAPTCQRKHPDIDFSLI